MRTRLLLLAMTATWMVGYVAMPAHASTSANTYTVQLDAPAPDSEPWDFLRMFPDGIAVHQGDVIDAAWAGSGAPHTASFVNTADPEGWRATNQCQGCPWTLSVPDSAIGGDDDEFVLNPPVRDPSSFTCGTASAPCSFDGSSVVTSGVQFSTPGAQPAFWVQVDAPPGQYSMLCLVHPGMEIPLTVKKPDKPVPSPETIAQRAARQVTTATTVDGPQADAQAQEVTTQGIGGGSIEWTINAGGFSNQVSAEEYVDAGLSIHVGDEVTILGNNEIHTSTFPLAAATRVPFIFGECEIPGPDPIVSDPSQCADPSQFQLAFNNKALAPSARNDLVNPNVFRNSGLLTDPTASYTFVAAAPGTYTMVCLVHGPEMTTTVTVEA